MNRLTPRLAALALTAATLASPCLAASSTASSASDSASTSVGSVSDSFKRSSNSSSRDKDVAEGDYRIIEVAAVAERPGTLRLTLQAAADHAADGEFELFLPRQAFDQSGLAAGRMVTAHQRPYGVEFANAQTRQGFYLVLSDEWCRELRTQPVTL